jgi:type II secretion system protein N
MKITGKVILYIAFTLLMVVVFLLFRFPSEMAVQLIDSQMTRYYPEVQVNTNEVSPTFPPGIKLMPMEVSYAGLPLFSADEFRIRPKLLSMFGANKSAAFGGSMGTGKIKGNAATTTEATRSYAKVVINLIAIPLEALELSGQFPGYRPSGDINAYVDYDSRKGSGGTAKINLDIVPVKIALESPLMGLEMIEFSQLKAELTATQRMLQIRRCEADGPQFEGKLSGSIIFRNPIENSRLTLSCTLRPHPSFVAEQKNNIIGGLLSSGNALKRGLVFRISGTLAKPRYVMR